MRPAASLIAQGAAGGHSRRFWRKNERDLETYHFAGPSRCRCFNMVLVGLLGDVWLEIFVEGAVRFTGICRIDGGGAGMEMR